MSTIQEDNKLIAEFMGFEWYEINKPYIAVREPNGGVKHFRTDWNWLMEVVEKIESINFILPKQEYGQYKAMKIKDALIMKYKDLTKIEAVYNTCVEFIKWYNEQN